MLSVLGVGLLGGMTGLHAATWGAFKDAPFEGFRTCSFVRSIVLGVTVAVVVASTTTLGSTTPVVALIGLLYTGERLATEWWKTFLREDPQTAYAIPMRLALRGHPVDARLPRYTVGLTVLVALVLCAGTAHTLAPVDPPVWLTVLVAGIGGWLTAFGGAWKDAPIEGFSASKFLRSPVVATGWVLLLLPTTRNWLLLAVAAGGLSVLSIETYKTFLTGGRPPGKFAGKPIRHTPGRTRETCRLLHSGLYLVLGTGLAGTLFAAGPDTVTSGPWLVSNAWVALLTLTLSAVVGMSPPPSKPDDMLDAGPRRAPSLLAMLGSRHSSGALPQAVQEPDADADLRREET